jgi:hypothetical protein
VTRTGLVAYPILQDRGLLRLSSREAAQKPPQEGHWLALSVRRVRALAEFHPDSRVIASNVSMMTYAALIDVIDDPTVLRLARSRS